MCDGAKSYNDARPRTALISSLEHHREGEDVAWQRVKEDRAYRDRVRRNLGHQHAPLVTGTLPEEPFTEPQSARVGMIDDIRVAGQQPEVRFRIRIHLIEHAPAAP